MIFKASQALRRLRVRVLNELNNRLPTKLKVYNSVVLTSLLYGYYLFMDTLQAPPQTAGEISHAKPSIYSEHSLTGESDEH